VLGVSRTLDLPGTGPHRGAGAPGTGRPTGAVEPAAVKADTAEAPVAALPRPAPASGAPPAVRGRSRWFVVRADPADPEHGPVAVLSGHTSQKAATAALGRARRRAWSGAGGGVGAAGPCRRADQLSAGVGSPGRAGRGAPRAAAVTPGCPRCAETRCGDVSDLLPGLAGYAEPLEQLKARVSSSRVRAARAANGQLPGLWPG